MKKHLFALVALVLLTTTAFAQTAPASPPNDYGQWFAIQKGDDGDRHTAKIAWYMYSQGKLFVEIRYNFDWSNATSAFVGRNFYRGADDQHKFTLEIGAIGGHGHKGLAPQFLSENEWGRFKLFTLTQVTVSFGDDQSFVYHFGDAAWKVKPWLRLGVDEQFTRLNGHRADLDIGPMTKVITPGNYYVKVWWSVNPTQGPQKTQVGVGKQW